MSKTKKPKKKSKRPVKTTPMQKAAVDNILSGRYPSYRKAMRAAGYKTSADRPSQKLARRKGVQAYLAKIDREARKRWGKPIREKVMDVYADGLEATKLVGKAAIEHPDHPTRKAFADRLATFFGWVDQHAEGGTGRAQYQQFNFFQVDEKRRRSFNDNFKKFLKRYYDQF